MNQKTTFRPEINGLRGVAVLIVIFFHLNNHLIPLGYLGVDIFFVLSGFLITSIILKDLRSGQFSFSEFFTRRIKRILPVLFVVILVTTIAAVLISSGPEYRSFTRSLRYASSQLSNFFFAQHTGYFDIESHRQPLLHTWSLAVEEQFYLVWPIALWFVSKTKRLLYPFLILSIVASFLTMIYLNSIESPYAFYMFYTRAWQLGFGALLASGFVSKESPKKANTWISIVSILAIVIPVLPFTQLIESVVISQILVCGGVCGVIYSSTNQDTLVKKLLSNKFLLYIGAISYSLYLWHWPIIVFYNYIRDAYFVSKNILTPQPLSFTDISVILTVCWALSALSYKFVENRYRYSKITNKKAFIYTIVVIGSFMLSAKFLQKQANNPIRISPFKENLYLSSLHITIPVTYEKEGEDILIIGDSHARHFTPMISSWAKQHDLKVKLLNRGGTAPMIRASSQPELLPYRAAEHNRKVKDYLLESPNIKYVFIAAAHYRYHDSPEYEEALTDTVKFLLENNKKVCLFAQTPPLSPLLIRYLEPTRFMNWLFPRDTFNEDMLAFDKEFVEQDLGPMRIILKNIKAKYPQVHIWEPEKYIESGIHEGIPCYQDGDHLNKHGSLFFVPHFDYPIE